MKKEIDIVWFINCAETIPMINKSPLRAKDIFVITFVLVYLFVYFNIYVIESTWKNITKQVLYGKGSLKLCIFYRESKLFSCNRQGY